MKLKFLALAFVAAAALAPIAARADDDVSLDSFYDNLAPYGDWIEVGDYGTCWHPTGVDADWAPYTDGYWSYTDAGWTWVSYEDFGDICYHYGRWVDVDDVGWCWVPDNEWGPAWVSWRQADDYVGWAPLPPEARWRPSVGFSVWVDDYCDIGPSYYNFCPIVDFGAPVIRHVCVPRVTVLNIFARTVNITNICWNGYRNVVFCGGPNFTVINARLHRPIPTFKLVQNNTIINNNVTVINNRRVVKFPRAHVAGNTLNVFAPKVVNKNVTNFKPHITKVVQKDKVNRGWKLQNQAEVAKLREKVKTESKGLNPETAPAKPVQVADLKPLPEKADPKAPSPVAGRDRPGRGQGRDDNDNKPDRPVADRPDRPDRPGKGPDNDGDRPGKVAGDRPDKGNGENRPGAGDDDKQPGKVAADHQGRDEDNNKRGQGNPLVRPFNEPKGPGERGEANGGGQALGKRQGQGGDGGGAAERQRIATEQAERQRAAQERMRQAEAMRDQMEQQKRLQRQAERQQQPPPQRQIDRQEQIQRQGDRQQQMQRQAELQQRQLQIQRQQQLQTQRQQQQQQIQRQQGGNGGGQGRQGQGGQGQGDGQGGKRQLSPAEREALKNQRGF